jgi:hypothetical protein
MLINTGTAGSPFTINGGIPIGKPITSPFSVKDHVESRSAKAVFGDEDHWMGILKLQNNFQRLNTPLISMTELSKSVIEVGSNQARFTFAIPFQMKGVFLYENLVKDVLKPGLGQQPFPIVFSENKFTYGDYLTTDQRNGKQIRILSIQEAGQDAEITPYNNGWKYLATVASAQKDDFYPQEFLKEGLEYFKMYTDAGGEFNMEYTKLGGLSEKDALQLYEYRIGSSEMGIQSWITSDAEEFTIKNNTEFAGATGLTTDPNAKNFINNYYGVKDNKPVDSFWIPTIIEEMVKELAEMKENRMMWSKGDYRIYNGRETRVINLGYYEQIKQRGNYYTYTNFKQLYELLLSLGGMLFGSDTSIPAEKRKIRWRMGSGAFSKMRQLAGQFFKDENPFFVDLKHPALDGVLTKQADGSLMFKKPYFSSFFFPETGMMEFVADPMLDNIDRKVRNHKTYEGKPLSAYMIFIEDMTDSTFTNATPTGVNYQEGANVKNVVMIKQKNKVDYMQYQVGAGSHPVLKKYIGDAAKIVSDPHAKGFGVFASTHGELWVQDPTRMIMLEFEPTTTI